MRRPRSTYLGATGAQLTLLHDGQVRDRIVAARWRAIDFSLLLLDPFLSDCRRIRSSISRSKPGLYEVFIYYLEEQDDLIESVMDLGRRGWILLWEIENRIHYDGPVTSNGVVSFVYEAFPIHS